MDFKLRALDFISIYVKSDSESKDFMKKMSSESQVTLIKGLLRALSVAFQDKNTALFDRIKTILAMIVK